MINMSEELYKMIQDEVARILILKEKGKSTLYSEGELWAYTKVIKECERLDDIDISNMCKQVKKALKEDIWER